MPDANNALGSDNLAIRCSGLEKSFADVHAVAGVDLTVRRGECFGLLGPNGAGKTTTVEILEGLGTADAGIVHVLGRRWGNGDDRELRQRVGICLQETQLADRLTVEEVIFLFRSFYVRGRPVDEVIAELDLEPKRAARYHKLSGGQKQRLAVACALVGDPELLFLDEPTTGLDPQARHRVWDVIERFRDRGGTVVLTTHYMEEAAHLCDRLAIMDHGKIIAEGTPASLIASLSADQILEFEPQGRFDAAALAALPGVRGRDQRNGRHVLTVTDVGAALPALLAVVAGQQTTLKSLETHQPTLEDVFVHLTGRELRDE
jgi:ABC-2 type transport system ATP-binding protein